MQLKKYGWILSIKWQSMLTLKLEKGENARNEKKTVTSANVTVSNSSKG